MKLQAASGETEPGTKPRFVKSKEGKIVDTMTGWPVARAEVAHLDTATADRVSDIIIEALHREFGPRRTARVV